MNKIAAFCSVLCLAITVSSFAQEEEPVNTGQDFTKPLTRFDIRYQYQKLSGDLDQNVMILRLDKPIPLDGGKAGIFQIRTDVPLMYGDAPSRDNPNGDYEFGNGDLFTQFLYIPSPASNADLPWDAWGFGAGMLWPTASQSQFGTEKYQLFPLVGFKWNQDNWSQGSFFTFLARYYMDIADYSGGDKRDDISMLEINPIIHFMIPKDMDIPFDFVTLWSMEGIRFNMEDGTKKQSGDIFFPLEIMFGKMLNRSTVFSLEFATPLYKDDTYDLYDWKLGARVGFFF